MFGGLLGSGRAEERLGRPLHARRFFLELGDQSSLTLHTISFLPSRPHPPNHKPPTHPFHIGIQSRPKSKSNYLVVATVFSANPKFISPAHILSPGPEVFGWRAGWFSGQCLNSFADASRLRFQIKSRQNLQGISVRAGHAFSNRSALKFSRRTYYAKSQIGISPGTHLVKKACDFSREKFLT